MIAMLWLPRGQQVSHGRWIWGFCYMQAMKNASKGNNAGFETQGRRHQKYKTGVLGAPQKGQMFSKSLKKLIIVVPDFRVRLQSRKMAGSSEVCRSLLGRRTRIRWSYARSDAEKQTRPLAVKAGATRSLSPYHQVFWLFHFLANFLKEWEWLIKMLFFNATIHVETEEFSWN